MTAIDYIFYYTGVLVWVIVGMFVVMLVMYYCIELWKHCIKYCLSSLKFYVFGVHKEWKGKCYEKWIENFGGNYGAQEYWHSMKYFRRLAYKRYMSEIIKERKSLTNN